MFFQRQCKFFQQMNKNSKKRKNRKERKKKKREKQGKREIDHSKNRIILFRSKF